MNIWLSIGIIALALMIVLLVRLRRNRPFIGTYEALAWTVFWVALALAFGLVVYFAYKHQWMGLGAVPGGELDGRGAVLQFFAGYLLQKSLSVDNIVVIAMIFACFRIPLEQQFRLLAWGLIAAVALRGLAVAGGIALIDVLWWTAYVFGALLIFTALRMLAHRGKLRAGESLPVRLLARRYPLGSDYDGGRFLISREGVRTATPLLPALVMIGSANLVFAVDAVPAIIAVTREPFIVLAAIVFALLGLHSLYFLLAGLIGRLYWFKYALAIVLVFAGIKMLLANHYPIPTGFSLAVIVAALGAGAAAAVFLRPSEGGRPVSPLVAEIEQLATLTVRSARRIVVLVTGSTVLLVGVLMIVTPGPAILVIPAGLAILATEFIWARRLLRRFHSEARNFSGSARRFFRRRRRRGDEDARRTDRDGE